MSDVPVNSKTLFGKMFEGFLEVAFPMKSVPNTQDAPPPTVDVLNTISKAVVDRISRTTFITVSSDIKNVTLLGDSLPEDSQPADHDYVDRYGVLEMTSSSSVRDKFILLDEGATTGEAQNYAVERVENNRNNIYTARVYVGVPWLFGGRPVFRGFVSYWLVSRSAVGLVDSGDFTEALKGEDADLNIQQFVLAAGSKKSEETAAWIKKFGFKTTSESEFSESEDTRFIHFVDKHDVKAVLSLSPDPKKTEKTEKTARKDAKFTDESWTDPTDQLDATELSKCVPDAIVSWAKRVASATGNDFEKSSLIFPYKSVDGCINTNALKSVLATIDDETDLPSSVRKSVREELEKIQKASVSIQVSFINKADALERGLIYGLVYEPLVKDTHDDFATAEDIEEAAHKYLPQAMLNIQHDKKKNLNKVDSVVVESYIAPCDFKLGSSNVQKGSWILVTKVYNKDLLQSIREGDITGYSLEGTAFKT